jgi:hypothetical protein
MRTTSSSALESAIRSPYELFFGDSPTASQRKRQARDATEAFRAVCVCLDLTGPIAHIAPFQATDAPASRRTLQDRPDGLSVWADLAQSVPISVPFTQSCSPSPLYRLPYFKSVREYVLTIATQTVRRFLASCDAVVDLWTFDADEGDPSKTLRHGRRKASGYYKLHRPQYCLLGAPFARPPSRYVGWRYNISVSEQR